MEAAKDPYSISTCIFLKFCSISNSNIYFLADYQKLIRKLKMLEDEAEDSQTECETQKRKTKHPHYSSIYNYDYEYSKNFSDEDIPPAPHLPKDQRKTIPEIVAPNRVIDKYNSTQQKNMDVSKSSSKTFMTECETQEHKTKNQYYSSMDDFSECSSDENIPPSQMTPKGRSKDYHLNTNNTNQEKTIPEIVAIAPKGKVNSTQQKKMEVSKSSSTFSTISEKYLNCNCQCQKLEGESKLLSLYYLCNFLLYYIF